MSWVDRLRGALGGNNGFDLRSYVLSTAGRRSTNQDRAASFQCPLGHCFLVTDGMGGYQGGELAAQIVAEQVQNLLTAVPPETDPARALTDAIEAVGRRVLEHADSDPSLANMGATVALVLIDGETFRTAHVGDSRAYLLRDRSLRRLTTDHTVAQRLVKSGAISEAEARTHRDSSVLTRSVGGSAVAEPAEISGPFALEAGDMILLCSDGISGSLDDSAIAEVLLENQNDEMVAKQLCQVAFDHGSDDNLTALIVRVNR